VLGVFAKWPEAGAVKTRLKDADTTWNVRVAHALLLDTLERLASVTVHRVVAFSPPEREADFAAVVAGRYSLTAQVEGDLGQRLSAFFRQGFEKGACSVVVVGTDSPTLPVAHVERAFVELESADVVLGPAMDGGYYLIGCTRTHGELLPLFEGIAWSSVEVLANTVARLRDPRWRLALLPPWYDVDTPADWAMLSGHLAALRRAGVNPGAPRIEALIASGTS
jgi:rSAM/selenodomain-associated transferase 1